MSSHSEYVAPPEYAAPLTELVRHSGYAGAKVTVTGAASVGATRATLFVDIEYRGETVEAVAQLGHVAGPNDSEMSSVLRFVTATEEAQILSLTEDVGVPVPPVLAFTDRFGGHQADALVAGRLAGLSVPRQILRSLPDETSGEMLAEECGSAMANIHRVAVESLPSSLARLDSDEPHEDYCSALDKQLSELNTFHPAIRWGINWLRRNPPSRPQSLTLVHSDFRNGNILVRDGRLVAVLDWELAHIGDPMEDLAWMCVRMWRFGNDERPCGGFGSVQALRRGYETAGGNWREDAFKWWLAARSAWWGIGLARQGAAFLSGKSSSIVHAASGRRVPELEYDLLTLIREQER